MPSCAQARPAPSFPSAAALVTLAAGCACGTSMVAPGTDASTAADDAWVFDDAPSMVDAPLDAFVAAEDASDAPREPPPDAPPFDCASCAPAGPCEELACDGACEYVSFPDGTACGDGVCVEGSCEDRRCGDGWRERGDGLAREGCDDRNTIAGDGCNDTCEPEAQTVWLREHVAAPRRRLHRVPRAHR